VTPDLSMRPLQEMSEDAAQTETAEVPTQTETAEVPPAPYDPVNDMGSMYNIAQITRVYEAWFKGYSGRGVGVALIDTGVSPVPGLDGRYKLVNGPDLSFDSQIDELRYLDAYGHGTHMASLIGGSDFGSPTAGEHPRAELFAGTAPGAHIVNVKVGAADGSTDVSQVIAAIDWVVKHRDELNIRVLNLSFGTDSQQDYTIDPLAYAAEVAWHKGIVVVAAAGNDGTTVPTLANPAYDPYLIAVGGDDPMGTLTREDDTIPDFATRSTTKRNVDVIAPATHILGLRVPGSFADTHYPEARVGTRFFRGSGTSQAAALTSGFVAVLLEKSPKATPDQIKDMLRATSYGLPYEPGKPAMGKGLIDMNKALKARLSRKHSQRWTRAMGTGSLEAARGSMHVADEGGALTGEQDIFGKVWDGRRWSSEAWDESSWSGGYWNGSDWAGDGWTRDGWAALTWLGRRWSGVSWSGRRWSDDSWTGRTWTGRRWSGDTWTGRRWSGDSWTGRRWSSASYGN
ncbi:MAG: S8 family serine peptidase, partial [Actinomycetota bacterium]